VSRHSWHQWGKSGHSYGFVALFLSVPSFMTGACRAERWLDELAPPRTETTSKAWPRGSSVPSTPQVSPNTPVPIKSDASIHLALGVPTDDSPDDDYLMRKPQYALSYNPVRNEANWVSWGLNKDWVGSVPRHKGKFVEERDLPQGFKRANHDDYTGSGYDRGHMVRSEERTRSDEDNRATFLMTNILPQYHDLNAGPWLRLEEHCEKLAKREDHELFIMAGGILPKGKRATDTIGSGIAVPKTFFKIIVILEKGQGVRDVQASTPVTTVIMPNETGIISEGWEQYRTSIDEIEKRTGYEFLSAVPESVQRVIEARTTE